MVFEQGSISISTMTVEVRKVVFYTESQSVQVSDGKLSDAILSALKKDDFLGRFDFSVPEVRKLRKRPSNLLVTWSGGR